MPKLSPDAIYQICLDVGFTPDQAVTWTAIALAESGGNTEAHNPHGESSWGLWQINVDPAVRTNRWGDLTDPHTNARAAYELSAGGTKMSPWTVTHDSSRDTAHDYRGFLDEAQAASGGFYHGNAAGVSGYGDDLPADANPPFDQPGPADDGAHSVHAFLDAALKQAGDPYVFGAEAANDDADPDQFDCSELVQWSAAQVGLELPDGSWLQYLTLKEQGATMSVEQALHTQGALLFSFSSEPTEGGGRPSAAHVAISLGDGTTIEARGRRYGVGSFDAGTRFEYAALIPGLSAAPPAGGQGLDTDGDFLSDYDEMSRGTDPALADTDHDGLLDGFEAALGTDPTLADTDRDGLSDAYELSRSHTDPTKADTDADGISDSLEMAAGTNPTDGVRLSLGAQSPGRFGLGIEPDTDRDGVTDAREQRLGSNAADVDTDHDGLIDGLELAAGTDLHLADSDADGLSDAFELSLGTDPLRADTDRDGLLDGAELASGGDPGRMTAPIRGGAPGGPVPAPPIVPTPAGAPADGTTSVTVDYEPAIGGDDVGRKPTLIGIHSEDDDRRLLDDDDDDDDV